MTTNLTIRPVLAWPGTPTKYPRRSSFGATYSSTLETLDRELYALDGKNPVVQLYVEEYQIRNDGGLRADARPSGPGVILSFDSKHGALRYSCDRFDHWHHNLRAIALALEALRKVDRYGVGTGSEQYAGWKALPSGGPIAMDAGTGFASVEDAAAFIAHHANEQIGDTWVDTETLLADPLVVPGAFRDAAKRLHPDAGGDPADFQRLTEAKRLLEEHTR